MILTVTLNAAMDVTYWVDSFTSGEMNRVRRVVRQAGGKGVNVARVLHGLGHEVLATGLAGGTTGDLILADLAGAGIAADFTAIAAESRSTTVVHDLAAQEATLLNEPGPAVTPEECAAFLERFGELVGQASVVVVSGSLPAEAPTTMYADISGLAAKRGVPVIVDADGATLLRSLDGTPTIVKPNASELAGALPELPDPPSASPASASPASASPASASPASASPASASTAPGSSGSSGSPASSRLPAELLGHLLRAEHLRDRGAGSVVVSLGAEGVLAVTGEGVLRARLPYRVEGNATGAGDALVAGLALGLAEGTAWPERLRRAAALGAAAVAAPVAGGFDEAVYAEISPDIVIEGAS
ncbi:1-phosphofructokinase family hexose kinase [Nonomuraea soli]|uniref:Tagatose 6-phosphate kinase n=1 Tax=Nonomuraea soli TaxID=1032476 RepID=A0A7W0CU45_9ACTN|nr:PfkB family carbohydrate kinase [Nonomuraea soli]MBA2897243.1 tagatose 6-phosphate kinase [Nonomuraea soli]